MTRHVEEQKEKKLPVLKIGPITRVQLVKYAGASGDFNPVHIDEEFAKNTPQKGIIAHGMLSMGFLSQYVEQIAGDPTLVKNIKVQFRALVRPGDIVTCKADETEHNDSQKKLVLKVLNQNGDIVVKGEALIDN